MRLTIIALCILSGNTWAQIDRNQVIKDKLSALNDFKRQDLGDGSRTPAEIAAKAKIYQERRILDLRDSVKVTLSPEEYLRIKKQMVAKEINQAFDDGGINLDPRRAIMQSKATVLTPKNPGLETTKIGVRMNRREMLERPGPQTYNCDGSCGSASSDDNDSSSSGEKTNKTSPAKDEAKESKKMEIESFKKPEKNEKSEQTSTTKKQEDNKKNDNTKSDEITKPPYNATPLGQPLNPKKEVSDTALTTPTPGSKVGGLPGKTRNSGTKLHDGLDDDQGKGVSKGFQSTNLTGTIETKYYGTSDGVVVLAGEAKTSEGESLGKRVSVYSKDTQGNEWVSTTMHHHEVLVKEGQVVKSGETIARGMGAGDQFYSKNAGAPHVHWRVQKNGVTVNPLDGSPLPPK